MEMAALKTSYHIYLFSDVILIAKYNSHNLEDVKKLTYVGGWFFLVNIENQEKAFQVGDIVYFARTKLLHQKMCENISSRRAILSPKKK